MAQLKQQQTLVKKFREQFVPLPEEQHAAFARLVPQPSALSQAISHRSEQYTVEQMQIFQHTGILKCYSITFKSNKSVDEFQMILDTLKARRHNFLLYSHFDDEVHATPYPSCKGNHYHLLLFSEFKNGAGNILKPSQTYMYDWCKKFTTARKYANPAVEVVRSIPGLVDYLKVYPRHLKAYSDCFIIAAQSGEFSATFDEHMANVSHYQTLLAAANNVKLEDVLPQEIFKVPMPVEPPTKIGKFTPADHVYEEIEALIKRSKCNTVMELIKWAKRQGDPVQTRVCTQLYRRQNFNQLFKKALTSIKLDYQDQTWHEGLTSWSPRKKQYMSIKESVHLLKKLSRHNIPINSTPSQLSLTEMLDNVLSRKVKKKNCIVLHGASNGGKSIVLQSAFEVFPSCAHLYQGISNNFMFESLEDTSVCLWDEALFAAEQQEVIKKSLSYRKDLITQFNLEEEEWLV